MATDLNDRVKKISLVLDNIERELTKRTEYIKSDETETNLVKKSPRRPGNRKTAKFNGSRD